MKHFCLLLTFCLGATVWASAQQEGTLSTMRSLPQHTYNNPAFVPQQKVYIGLPGISSVAVSGSTNSFTISQFKASGLEDSITANTLMAIEPYLSDQSKVSAFAQADLLSFGFRVNPRLYLRYRANISFQENAMFPKELVFLGDQEFVNKAQSVLLNPFVDAMMYLENSIGASFVIDHKLTIGANIKRLNGIATLQTDQLGVNLSSRAEDELLYFEGGMLAFASGLQSIEEDLQNPSIQLLQDNISKNGGWAVDLGGTYQLTPKLQLGLSVLNLGGIKWSDDAREYRTENVSFTAKKLDGFRTTTEALVDSLEKYLIPQENRIASFRTGLPTRTYLNATYEIHRNLMASGIFFSQFHDGEFLPGFTAAIHKDFGRRIGSSISYTAINGTYSNLGAGLSFRLTPFQLYVVTDNLLGTLDYENSQNLNVRAGLNLLFGTIKKPTKLPY